MLIGVVITPLDEEAFNLGGIESASEPMETNGHVVRKIVVVIVGSGFATDCLAGFAQLFRQAMSQEQSGAGVIHPRANDLVHPSLDKDFCWLIVVIRAVGQELIQFFRACSETDDCI